MIQILVAIFFIAFLESRDFNSCKKHMKNFSTKFFLYDVIMAPDLENRWVHLNVYLFEMILLIQIFFWS